MHIAYLVPATQVIRDQYTKKMSAIGIFANFKLPKEGVMPPQFFVVVGKINDVTAGQVHIDVKLFHESDFETSVFTSTLNGRLNTGDLEIEASFGPVRIEQEGKYYLQVYHNGVLLPDEKQFYITATRTT